MKNTFDYRLEAERCLEAAERATSGDSRKFLLAMARVWANLAGDDHRRRDKPSIPAPEADVPRELRTLS